MDASSSGASKETGVNVAALGANQSKLSFVDVVSIIDDVVGSVANNVGSDSVSVDSCAGSSAIAT